VDLFGIFSYVCLGFLILNLLYLLLLKSKGKGTNSTIVLINSLFLVIISNLSIWQSGIYVDEYNLSGDSIAFYINLLNIIIFIIIAIISFRKNVTKH